MAHLSCLKTAHDDWVAAGTCRQTCYEQGAGYEGDACCIEESPMPAPTPGATPSAWKLQDFENANEIAAILKQKHGLVCYSCDLAKYTPFSTVSSWAYNCKSARHDSRARL